MGTENSIQGLAASVARGGKFTANIVRQFVCFVVDLLFRNSQDLTEVALDGRFDRTISLDRL